ncbi:MAG: diguanylate cyclase [Magnetococcales bacterium]|nr:diguanylate cyclase [Magnetococcales bacterium]
MHLNDYLAAIKEGDSENAIQLADHVWWVGHYLPGDPFQCHTYLIELGDQSILFDPGSPLTFEHTLRKIKQIIPFEHIRYFVCHHQDPDITAIMPTIDTMISRDDAVLVSHWRTNVLLKHYGLKMPLMCIEKNDWTLKVNDYELSFILTPYLHFPGAFCTYDHQEKILFSSDLFGGFTEGWDLIARDEGYFENLRPFHEHYMPSRDILVHGLVSLEIHPIDLIAPQHGRIIPGNLVKYIFSRLKEIDCGLYLMTRKNTDIQRLSRINTILRDLMETIILHRSFSEIVPALIKLAEPILPVETLEFFSESESGEILHLGPTTRYRGKSSSPPATCKAFLGLNRAHWNDKYNKPYLLLNDASEFICPDLGPSKSSGPVLIIPLFSPGARRVHAVAVFHLSEKVKIDLDMEQVLEQISVPLAVVVERESIYRSLDMERQQLYNRSIRDPLTNLYTRFYMQETVRRLFDIHNRDANATIAIALFDIDFFKKVNDTFGHNAGDDVLKDVAEVLLDTTRGSDVPVRLGGEEFAMFIVGNSLEKSVDVCERIRKNVERLTFQGKMDGYQITISAGLAMRKQKEQLTDALERADKLLYYAKNNGRNQVCFDEDVLP